MSRLLPIAFVLIAFGIFFGYIRPTWNGSIAESKKEIASYDAALEAAERFKDKQASLEAARNQIPPDQLARLNAFLPDSVDNVQLILDLNALATRAGLTLSDFETSETVNEDAEGNQDDSLGTPMSGQGGGGFNRTAPTDSLTLSVSATGTYNAFRSFMAGVEQSLRPLDVIALTVEDSDTGVYTYEMTLKFYWLH